MRVPGLLCALAILLAGCGGLGQFQDDGIFVKLGETLRLDSGDKLTGGLRVDGTLILDGAKIEFRESNGGSRSFSVAGTLILDNRSAMYGLPRLDVAGGSVVIRRQSSLVVDEIHMFAGGKLDVNDFGDLVLPREDPSPRILVEEGELRCLRATVRGDGISTGGIRLEQGGIGRFISCSTPDSAFNGPGRAMFGSMQDVRLVDEKGLPLGGIQVSSAWVLGSGQDSNATTGSDGRASLEVVTSQRENGESTIREPHSLSAQGFTVVPSTFVYAPVELRFIGVSA